MPHNERSAAPGARRQPSVPVYVPPAIFLALGAVAIAVGIAQAYWIGAALIVVALCLSGLVAWWAYRQRGALVAALALVIFWLPFHTSFSRFNIGPQEIAVYLILIIGALLHPLGVRHWVASIFASITPLTQVMLLLLTLASLQSLFRIAQPSLIDDVDALRNMLVYPVLLAVLVAFAVRTRAGAWVFVQALVWGGVCFGGYALLLRIWGVAVRNGAVAGRLGSESTFLSGYHPNNLSLYLAIILALMPAVMLRNWQRTRTRGWVMVMGIVGTVIALTALILTYARGALVAFVIGMLLLCVSIIFSLGRRARLMGIGGLAVAAVGVIGLIAWKGSDILGRYATLTNLGAVESDDNVQFRLNLYNRALELINGHLFTGIGLGNFSSQNNVPFSPHDTYLDLLVNVGLFGAIAFVLAVALGILAAIGVARWSRPSLQQRLLGYGLAAGLVMFLIEAFTETFEQQPRIAPLVWVFVAIAEGALLGLQQRQARAHAAQPAQPAPATLPKAPDMPVAARANGNGKGGRASVPGANGQQANGGNGRGLSSSARWAAMGEAAFADEVEEEAVYEQASQILPAIPRTWGFETGDLPVVENPWSAAVAAVTATGQHAAVKAPGFSGISGVSGVSTGAHADTGETPSGQLKTQKAAEDLLRRAPSSYIWNQIYQLWFFAANFLLSIVLTRGLSNEQYGVFAVITTIIGTLTFSFALGLEDAATVFVPRVLTRDGRATAGGLIRRLLISRMLVMGSVGFALVIALPTLLPLFAQAGILGSTNATQNDGLSAWRLVLMALYLISSSLVNLEAAFFNAILNSRVTLIIGGISQVLIIGGAGVLILLGYGVDGVLLGLSVAYGVTALAYLFPLRQFLFARDTGHVRDMGDLQKLMVGSWLTNVTNGALGKQMDILLMGIFAISVVQIGYYNLAYQLGNIVGLLLISGLGGVGMAALSAALAAGGRQRLSEMWRVSIMLQALFAVPLQIFCLVQADAIIETLYGSQYAEAALLFRIFLAFSILGRVTGGGANQSALYVLKRQRFVLFARWTGLAINVALDVLLIPRFGPVGALIGTGVSQVSVGLAEMLWTNREMPSKYPFRFTSNVVSAAALPAILLLWWSPTGFIGLVISFIGFAALFIAILLWLGVSDAEELQAAISGSARLQQLLNTIGRFLPRRLALAK